MPFDIGQRRQLKHHRFRGAGDAGETGGDYESGKLVALDAITQGNRARLVFTDGLENCAKTASESPAR